MQEEIFTVYQNSLNYDSLITTQLQPNHILLNYNSLNFKIASTILGICLWKFHVTFLKYVSFKMSQKSIFVPSKTIFIFNQKSFKIEYHTLFKKNKIKSKINWINNKIMSN